MKIIHQPKYTPGTKYQPQEFSIQELPDPDACLTEEQKTWPLCNTWKPVEPPAGPTPADQPPQPTPPAE